MIYERIQMTTSVTVVLLPRACHVDSLCLRVYGVSGSTLLGNPRCARLRCFDGATGSTSCGAIRTRIRDMTYCQDCRQRQLCRG